jgi:type III secretion protein C
MKKHRFLNEFILALVLCGAAPNLHGEEDPFEEIFIDEEVMVPEAPLAKVHPATVFQAAKSVKAVLPRAPSAGEYTINFHDVPVVEFIRFVSRISNENFIFDHRDLQFNVTLSSGKSVTSEQVVKALIQILRVHGFAVAPQEGYLVIHREERSSKDEGEEEPRRGALSEDQLMASLGSPVAPPPRVHVDTDPGFLVHKLQYHPGGEIEETVRKISSDLAGKGEISSEYLHALQSVQWVKATNSLVCSGNPESLVKVKHLIESLDVPLRQVFIEVLVIETDIRKGIDFGLQWAAGGKYKDSFGGAMGNFPASHRPGPFSLAFQGIDAVHPPTGPGQIPLGSGFDLGVIGDIIMHKGQSFLSLGSLVSALQTDGESTIVLNQKIITQDSKNSTIFVGDNIPFTGSVVQTVGSSQQTTANIEYRDVGVTLSITPRLGEENVITIDLSEEITEALQVPTGQMSNTQVNGIQTTKTNMMTHVHVPDQHFLVLSGMIRNAKVHHKSGLPCLGGLLWIGAAFSKNHNQDEKRNVIIFIRPRIIHSMDDFRAITEMQENLHERHSQKADFQEGLGIVKGS